MGSVIGQMLPYAVGIAISPIPVVAVILMLFSRRAGSNGPAYLAGWVTGLFLVIVVVQLLAGLLGAAPGSPPAWAGWLKLLLGILLVVLGVRRWRTRPPTGSPAPLPPWLHAVDDLRPGTAFAMGALLSGVNPKNLALTVAATLVLVQAGLSGVESLLAAIVFVAIASASVAGPLVYQALGGPAARTTLDTWRAWLEDENATVMAVVLVVLGVVLVGHGLAAL
jgi:threonine/homoserine/homoserine lactone efflux protein